MVIFATATILAFVLLRNSTACSYTYSEIGPEVRCDLSRLLVRKITKRIHSSKPASLNRPIGESSAKDTCQTRRDANFHVAAKETNTKL